MHCKSNFRIGDKKVALIVQKYGGTSVANLERIKNVASRVAKTYDGGNEVVVILSAMAGITDGLIQMAGKISELPDKRELDVLLATGEQTTSALLAMTLKSMDYPAQSLMGHQAEVLTDHCHGNARILDIRADRIKELLKQRNIVVVAGFQGCDPDGNITTLGRGGSDTTAVALAAALDAECCEIYSDVDGVYSADPSIVGDSSHLPEISYAVMQEMSMAGAKVLNAGAVQFAKEKNIAIYARSTFDPGRETVIRRLPPGAVIGVQAVVSEKEVERLRVQGPDAGARFKQAVEYLESEQVPIKEVNVVETVSNDKLSRASFVISTQNIYGWEQIKIALLNKIGAGIEFDIDLAALSLIGEGLNRNNLTLLETLDLLAENEIPVFGVTTTSFRISLLLPRNRIEDSVRLCHNRWVAATA